MGLAPPSGSFKTPDGWEDALLILEKSDEQGVFQHAIEGRDPIPGKPFGGVSVDDRTTNCSPTRQTGQNLGSDPESWMKRYAKH